MTLPIRQTGHAVQVGVQRLVDQVTAPTETNDPMIYRVASDVFFNDAAGIPHPLVESAGGVKSLVAADSPYTVLESDRLILANTTAGAITLTLPAAGGPYLGRRLRIVDKARQFAVNNLTINGNGNNINGAATLVLSTQDGGVELVWGGTTWERDAIAAAAMGAHAATHAVGGGDSLYDGNTSYLKEVNHTVNVAASTTAATAGGNLGVVGGAGSTSGAGGVASLTGGVGGATGAGGAVAVTGGAGGATSGTGGAVTLAGGAGSAGNANGGALTIRGGAKNGSGADGAVVIGDSNTASVTIGAAGVAFSLGRGTVSQATNINTDVTCNANSGVITTQTATTAAATMESGFTLNNSCISAASVITVQVVGYSGTHITNGIPYLAVAAPGAGTVGIKVGNIHAANALNGTLKIHFSIS